MKLFCPTILKTQVLLITYLLLSTPQGKSSKDVSGHDFKLIAPWHLLQLYSIITDLETLNLK